VIFVPSFFLARNFHSSNVHCVAFLVLVFGSCASLFFKSYVSLHPETFPAGGVDYFVAKIPHGSVAAPYGTCFIFENN
jgi:hypothetical protein